MALLIYDVIHVSVGLWVRLCVCLSYVYLYTFVFGLMAVLHFEIYVRHAEWLFKATNLAVVDIQLLVKTLNSRTCGNVWIKQCNKE